MNRVLLILVGLIHMGLAELRIPSIFSDGAIFQCDKAIPIWGWGTAGDKIRISFAGQSRETKVKHDGTWDVRLPPSKASYLKHRLNIQSKDSSIILKDILIGEVWLCAGQSNMMYTLEMLSLKTKDEGYESVLAFMRKEKDSANDEFLRQIKVPEMASVIDAQKDFNGQWLESTPRNNGNFSGTAYFFAKELRKVLDCPVGIINVSWGGKRIESFIPPSEFNHEHHKKLLKKIKEQAKLFNHEVASQNYQQAMTKYREDIKLNHKKGLPRPRRPVLSIAPDSNPAVPGAIYNGMVNPIVSYAIRGAVWYQGESHNPNKPQGHQALLKSLIRGWRSKWEQGSFPIYFCQLANFGEVEKAPLQKVDSWVEVSNQLRLTMQMPNTGMAVLHDVGQVKDIHPVNKYDVGKRLSRWALHDVYKKKNLVPSGPLFNAAKRVGSQIKIDFDYSGSGLVVGKKHLIEPVKVVEGSVSGFEVCDEDGEWHYAEATIMSSYQVLVSHSDILKPIGVRYAWQKNPENANLYNMEGLPTAIFSTTEFDSND